MRLELESSPAAWTGEFVPGLDRQDVFFASVVTGRYLCLESLSAQDGRAYASVAEVDFA